MEFWVHRPQRVLLPQLLPPTLQLANHLPLNLYGVVDEILVPFQGLIGQFGQLTQRDGVALQVGVSAGGTVFLLAHHGVGAERVEADSGDGVLLLAAEVGFADFHEVGVSVLPLYWDLFLHLSI